MRHRFTEYADTAKFDHVAYNVCQVSEPRTTEETIAGEQVTVYKEAADSEYKSLIENET